MSIRPNPTRRPWRWLNRIFPTRRTQAAMGETYRHFQRLLAANNRVLSLMADMEEKLSGDFLFDLQYIVAAVAILRRELEAMVAALEGMAPGRYPGLKDALPHLLAAAEAELHPRRAIPVTPLVLFFQQVDAGTAEIVGSKNASLGEARNRLRLPVPNGFAISTYAHKVFLEHHRLRERITERLDRESLKDLEDLERLSGEIREMIRRAPLPPNLENALTEAYEKLAGLEKGPPFLAIRSSPPADNLIFAEVHQFPSFLNIPAGYLAAHFKELVAGCLSPRALFYFKTKGFKEDRGGLGDHRDDHDPGRGERGAFHPQPGEGGGGGGPDSGGLGGGAISGRPARARGSVPGGPPARGRILTQVIARQESMLVCRPDAGLEEVPVHPREVEAACLNETLIRQLLGWAEVLEAHFGKPQEVSWALDYDGKLWFLQCRPLSLPYQTTVETRPRTLKQYPVLLDQGTIACRGVGAGRVVILGQDDEVAAFPQGGVLVLKHTSPRYVPIIPRAAAIVADHGSLTGHMALMARQYQIPTILNAGLATRVLQPGQEVTVDANYNNVYAGIIPELTEQPRPAGADMAETLVFQTLKGVIQKVVPLNLLDPQEANFTAEGCRTLHDLARFAHEMAMREMFRLAAGAVKGGWILDLETEPVLKIRVLDLGGGVHPGWRRRLRPAQIDSHPFPGLLAGAEGRGAGRRQARPRGGLSGARLRLALRGII